MRASRSAEPRVSVVIPTRDRAAFAREAVRTALAQVDVPIEVIVVDDGSDPPVSCRWAWSDEARVRVERSEVPEGVAAARNRGIAAARAPWIAFLDDDDLWAPYKVAVLLENLEATSAVWGYGGVMVVDDDGDVVAGGRPPLAERTLREIPFRNVLPGGPSSVMARTDTLRALGGFDAALSQLADWDLWIRLAGVGPPAVVQAPLVYYRRHAAAMSRRPKTLIAEMDRIQAATAELRAGAPVDRAHLHRWMGWNAMLDRRRISALRSYLSAAAEGDLSSLGRALVAALAPGWATRPRRIDPVWRGALGVRPPAGGAPR